jgi:predicted amidohydrolase
MKRGRIKVATCQFGDGADVAQNAEAVRDLMADARRRRADVAVFHEAALTGYPAGLGFPDWRYLDWNQVRTETESILNLARQLRLWVILGSAHPLTGRHKPHNCLYAISPAGRIVDRYDKRFCTTADLAFYSPGDHFSVFDVNGVRCGMLICFDVRFAELYRAYVRRGVRLMFHSFHNARGKTADGGIWEVIMRPSIQALAAANHLFVSAPNSCARHQSWPGVFVTPDGRIASSHRKNVPGLLVDTVDLKTDYYDASRHWRPRALRGVLHSGRLVKDRRSRQRTAL